MQIYLNGSFLDSESAKISLGDRGFIFGDGIYEVIRVVDGKLFQTEAHLERMREGLGGLQIRLPQQELERFPEICQRLLEENHLLKDEATVYVQVTRGAAWPRTHTFPDPDVTPTVYLSAAPFIPHTNLHEKGIDVITLSDQRWARCNLKTVNLLPNVLARQQAVDAGVNSAIMIRDGMITESPNANIFGVRDGMLFTFPVSNYILNGITRRVVLEIAEEIGIEAHTTPIHEKDLFSLDELFFSGTTTDIQPVTEINGKDLGEGRPGPVVRQIQEAYRSKLYS